MSIYELSFAQLMGGCYSEINASKVSIKWSDLNLKGKVKTIKTTYEGDEKSTLSTFNRSGFLISLSDSNTNIVNTYQNDRLVHVQYNSHYESRELVFNASGFLEKKVKEINGDKKNIIESTYMYNVTFDTLVISYKYNPGWKYFVLIDSFYFSFDEKGRIIQERNVAVYSDKKNYGSTKTYAYDSIGNLTRVTFMSDCAREGANSCRNLDLTMRYDERNNLVYQQLYDGTVRNSLWSDGYTYHAIYNEHDDVIDSDFEQQNVGGLGIIDINKTGKTQKDSKIIYKYDAKGNWIKKYVLENGQKKMIQKRVIEYYH